MSMFVPNENKLVTCPYDEAHKVKASRLQLHIAKCKLNHLDVPKKVCPFNATHLLPVGEYDHHLTTCPDRAPLDRQLAQAVNRNNPFKGRTDVPQYSDPIELDEVWEIEPNTVSSNLVSPTPPPGAILQPGEFQKPAERKKFYNELHRLPAKTETASQNTPPAKTTHVPPRQPKQHSIVKENKPNSDVIENLGLGRGRPASTRIAANFAQVESPESTSYSNIVSDMANLGLGRGKPSGPSRAPASILDDDDFPALGCGRGIVHRQNVRHPGAKPKN